eukprot:3949476-Alexandrium_andersonii.AAC.1
MLRPGPISTRALHDGIGAGAYETSQLPEPQTPKLSVCLLACLPVCLSVCLPVLVRLCACARGWRTGGR